MSSELSKNTNPLDDFKQRVLEKLKTDIGSLMPDEVLADLVKQAVKDHFFKPTRVRNPVHGYSQPDFIDGPSWFMAEVVRLVEPMMKERVSAFVQEHHSEIDAGVAAALERDKLLHFSSVEIGSQIGIAVSNGMINMMQEIQNRGMFR